ncbi:zinc finger protein 420-like [Lingula anatina]|uniref:Zinc finger protein 420-like n=1 Tax=Lingula anatina TaxID=7574 RepID=A0A1S3HDZ0_LINAN|nr:zinc finger protein 420-like [Lingula anatina]|eukprot:XP_013383721.1 zinc finger protein 420-like [Lingula anatina]
MLSRGKSILVRPQDVCGGSNCINIGKQIERWKTLKEQMNLVTNEGLAKYLLDTHKLHTQLCAELQGEPLLPSSDEEKDETLELDTRGQQMSCGISIDQDIAATKGQKSSDHLANQDTSETIYVCIFELEGRSDEERASIQGQNALGQDDPTNCDASDTRCEHKSNEEDPTNVNTSVTRCQHNSDEEDSTSEDIADTRGQPTTDQDNTNNLKVINSRPHEQHEDKTVKDVKGIIRDTRKRSMKTGSQKNDGQNKPNNCKEKTSICCQTCGKTCKSSPWFRDLQEVYQCKKCKRTNKKQNIDIDKDSSCKPRPNRVFICQHCGKEFSRLNRCVTHEKIHRGERPYTCFCGKGFPNSSKLKMHEMIHVSEKPFKCQFCCKAFTKKSACVQHERVHTGEKPYKCKFCEKTFAQLPTCNRHEKIHTGEQPYKCVFCGKAFIEKSHCKNHERIHRGDKVFHCQFCEKSFIEKRTLVIHERLHTGEKPYKCNYCEVLFARRDALNRHERVHLEDNT